MGTYNKTVEYFRDKEYPQIQSNTCVHQASTALPAKSLIDSFSNDLHTASYINPVSDSTSSNFTRQRIEKTRRRILHFLKANSEDFDLVFVPNAITVIDVVARCSHSFSVSVKANKKHKSRNLSQDIWYGYHREINSALLPMHEITDYNCRRFVNDADIENWITNPHEPKNIEQLGLFLYPGQSNTTGQRLPVNWSKRVRANGRNTFTLLDATALAPTLPLDLDTCQPDFTLVCFCRIFGFPNLSGLVIRKASAHVLAAKQELSKDRSSIGAANKDACLPVLHEQFEDATIPFLSIVALDHALNAHEKLYVSMIEISLHTTFLSKYLFDSLSGLMHPNGAAVCQIYKDPASEYGDSTTQGPTVAFNIRRSDGDLVGAKEAQKAAETLSISIGVGDVNLQSQHTTRQPEVSRHQQKSSASHTQQPAVEMSKPVTALIATLGACSTKADIHALVRFLRKTYVEVPAEEQRLVPAALPKRLEEREYEHIRFSFEGEKEVRERESNETLAEDVSAGEVVRIKERSKGLGSMKDWLGIRRAKKGG